MSKPIAGPWGIDEAGDGRIDIFGAKGIILATMEDLDEAEENAKLIVKAVNCHDELLKALEDTLKMIDNASWIYMSEYRECKSFIQSSISKAK